MVGSHVVSTSRPRVGLALAGGAARGLSHLGVLDLLEELGVPLAVLAGTSMGALIAAARGLGHDPKSLMDISRSFSFRSLFRPAWPGKGLSSPRGLADYTRHLFGEVRLEDSSLELRLTATDFDTGERVVFSQGPAWAAVTASACIPVLFAPFEWEGRRLVDGGLKSLNPTRLLDDCDFVIGTYLGLVRMTQGPVKGFRDTLAQTCELLAHEQILASAAAADLMIEPDVLTWNFLDFSDPENLRQRGYQAAQAHQEILVGLGTTGRGRVLT